MPVQDVDRLLTRLEALGGAEEAEVVRFALAAGVPSLLVLEELEREVARRTARADAAGFYEDWA